jgi:HNH endonuclease
LSNRKNQILERISLNASKFDAAYAGAFVCPTCLEIISLNTKSEITEAHIIPKYSGGSLKTYLCKRCNSHFGNNQDHWFGEYVYLANNGKSLFASRKQNRTFIMNGVEVAGKFIETNGGHFQISIYKNLMSPVAISAMKAAETPGRVQITTQIPILKNTRSIIVGFLTAAYLLWFKELGYSWVFQSHLNSVRAQILNPTKRIISDICVVDAGDKNFERPWIGFLEIENDNYLCAGIVDRIVILPSYNNPNVYKHLAKLAKKQINAETEAVRISNYHSLPDPIGTIYRDQVMTFPDHFHNGLVTPRVFRYLGDGQPPQIFHQMDN